MLIQLSVAKIMNIPAARDDTGSGLTDHCWPKAKAAPVSHHAAKTIILLCLIYSFNIFFPHLSPIGAYRIWHYFSNFATFNYKYVSIWITE